MDNLFLALYMLWPSLLAALQLPAALAGPSPQARDDARQRLYKRLLLQILWVFVGPIVGLLLSPGPFTN